MARDGATAEEVEFLLHRRVELNAFTSGDLIAWIEGKLKEHGVEKVIPDEAVLHEAYRRRHQSRYLTDHFDELVERSRQHVENLDIPVDLVERVAQRLRQEPALSWDDAVGEITKSV